VRTEKWIFGEGHTHTSPYAVINTDKQDGKLLNILMPATSSVGIDTRT